MGRTTDAFLAAEAANPDAAAAAPGDSAFSKGLRAGGLDFSASMHGLAGQAGEGAARWFGHSVFPELRDGASAFAARQRAAATQDQQAGAQAMEGVPTRLADVHTLGDGWDYASGMAARSLPMMGAGIVGGAAAALAAPELAGAALLGGTAATAPQLIGEEYNAQQADPVQAAQPYGLRTGMGAGVGTVKSGLMNVIPQMMGGRLFGRTAASAAEHAVAPTFGQALAANTVEAVGGNALAGAASTAVGQHAASFLNPQRDRSGDAAEMGESAAGSALLGVPLAPFGALGSMRGHAPESRPLAGRAADAVRSGADSVGRVVQSGADSVGQAVRSGADAVRGVFSGRQEEQALHDIAGGDTDGVKTLDPDAYASASPAAREAMRARADQTRLEQVQQAASELWNDQQLSPASRDALAAMGDDLSSAANRMAVAGMALAQRGAKTAMAAVDELTRWVDEQRAQHADAGPPTMSEEEYNRVKAENPAPGAPQEAPRLQSGFSPEITQAVKDIVMPYLQERNPALLQNPDAINKLADNLRYVMAYMTDARPSEERPPLPEPVIGHLQRVFGGAAPRVLHALTTALSPDDLDLMHKVNELGRVSSLGAQRARTVADVLGEDTVAHYHLRQDELQTLGDALAKHADGSAYRDLGKADAAFQQRHFEDTLREQFGDETANKLLISAAKDAPDRSPASSLAGDRALNDEGGEGLTSQHAGLDSDLSSADILGGDDLGAGERIESGLERSGVHGDQLGDQYEPTSWHGEGGNNRLVRTTAAWRAHAESMKAKGKKYDLEKDAPSVRLYRKLQRGEGRDRNVEFVPFKDLPRDLRQTHTDRIRASTEENIAKGMSHEQAEAEAVLTHGDPNEVGLFKIDGMKQEGRLSKADLDYITVDTSLDGHKENASRIITGKLGHSIDALRLVKLFSGRLPDNPETGEKGGHRLPWNRTDERGSDYRLARVFMEGIAAVQDALQKGFKIPDTTVVRLGRVDPATGVRSPGLTWGQLKKLGMMPHDAGRGGDAFTDFLHHATPDELRTELAHQQDLLSQQEAAEAGVRARIDDMKRTRRYFDKNIVRQMYADARVEGARDAPFHIQRLEQAVEDIGKQPLVERIDSSDPKIKGGDMAARQDGGLPGGELFNRTETVQGHDVVKNKDKEWVPRPNGRYREAEAASHGMQREIDPLGQVHVARDGTQFVDKPWNGGESERPAPLTGKEQALVVTNDLAGDPINHRGPARDREGPVVRAGREIETRIVAMEMAKSETGRALGRKARALDDFYDSVDLNAKGNEEIKRAHERFRTQLREAQSSSEVAAMINNQHAKYADRIAQVPGAGEPGGAGRPGKYTAAMPNKTNPTPAVGLRERLQQAGSTNPYFAKDLAKAQQANKFIGRGSARSSTERYRVAAGDLANTGHYTPDDTVFISAEGARAGRVPIDRAEIGRAVDAGATIITDDQANRSRSYNVGEREVEGLLTKSGYAETAPGVWKPAKAKPDPFVAQALAGGQSTDKVVARVATSTNAEGMAGALKTLLAHPEQNAHSARVVQALNERIGQLAHDDPSAAYNLTRKGGEDDGTMYSRMSGGRDGYDTFRSRSPNDWSRSAFVDRIGPVEKAHVFTSKDRDGDVTLRVTDAHSKIDDPILSIGLYKNADGKWELWADGPRPDGVTFARFADRLDTIANKDSDPYGHGYTDGGPDAVGYTKFKDGVFSVSEMRKLIRTLRGHAAELGIKPDAIMLGRDTGIAAGKPYKELNAKQIADFSRQRANNPTASTISTRADVEQHIQNVLGPRVAVAWRNLLHAGDFRRVRDAAGNPMDLIRLSLHSLDPMSTAFHETFHAFQQRLREADLHGVNAAFYKAADSFIMRGKLEKLLANEPDALRQIRENSPRATEERAAYLYQFYHMRDANGNRLLELNEAPRTVVEKIAKFIRNVLGIWSNDERAMHIMDYLHSGEYARTGLNDRNAVARALLERGTNPMLEGVKKAVAPLTKIATSVLAGGHAALADLNNPAINTILKKLYSPGISQDLDAGWIVAQRSERTAVLNGLMAELGRTNTTAEQLQQAMQQLQSGVRASSPEARLLAHQSGPIRQMLDKMHAYMETAGVKLGDLGVGADYFPVVYDTSYIASHAGEWRTMLDKYVRRGVLTAAAADSITAKLITNEGNTFGATDMPGMAHIRERKLDFLDPQDRAPFQQKDMIATLNSYVTQATRRAEWTRRFGADNARLDALKLEAVKRHGATPAQIAQLERYIEGVNGTLGDDISPGLRRIFGNAIVYQNIRLLPMAVFSMAVDPMGIMVRGGTLKEAFSAFKRGITEIPRGFQKNPKADPMYDLSKLVGTIDDAALVHTLGTGFSQGMVGDTGRRMNDTFFKYNLVEQMNTSMRVAALPAALNFMARHAAGENAHSTRYLAELGLTKDDVIMAPGGDRPLLSKEEFLAHGMNDADATSSALKMRLATNKWVDGAVLRPNQAQKPTWMNDPHWSLVAHLKQFVYAYHDTVLKRVLHEAKHGNYTPAMALASYVPIMMAADFMKGALLGGGSQPDYKAGWDLADWISAGAQRAGLFTVGQFGIDAYKDLRYDGTGLGPLFGPQLEQIIDALRVAGGRKGVAPFLGDALPASAVAKAIGHFGASKADPTFTD